MGAERQTQFRQFSSYERNKEDGPQGMIMWLRQQPKLRYHVTGPTLANTNDIIIINEIYSAHVILLSSLPLDKMKAISRMTFWNVFHERKVLHFDLNLTEICSEGSSWQWVSIGAGNGLAPNRRQAITWTNADPDSCHHMASLGHNKLKLPFIAYFQRRFANR